MLCFSRISFDVPINVTTCNMLGTWAAEEGVQGVQLHPHPKTWGCKHIFLHPQKS